MHAVRNPDATLPRTIGRHRRLPLLPVRLCLRGIGRQRLVLILSLRDRRRRERLFAFDARRAGDALVRSRCRDTELLVCHELEQQRNGLHATHCANGRHRDDGKVRIPHGLLDEPHVTWVAKRPEERETDCIAVRCRGAARVGKRRPALRGPRPETQRAARTDPGGRSRARSPAGAVASLCPRRRARAERSLGRTRRSR